MPDINAGFAMTLPPARAIAYFRSKGLRPTMSWKEMQDEAHAVEFVVAGITKLDVLSDIQNSLTDDDNDAIRQAVIDHLGGED